MLTFQRMPHGQGPLRLNLGSSRRVLPGWVNVDIRPGPGIDLTLDLNETRWPWPDASVDEIDSRHCFEHLANPARAIAECWRILRPGGKLGLTVPNVRGQEGFSPAHLSYFSRQYFMSFGKDGCVDNQISVDWMFRDVRIEMHLFHWALPWKPWKQRLIRAWEGFWNAGLARQVMWDALGVLPPDEIRFEGIRTAAVPEHIGLCPACAGAGMESNCRCPRCCGFGFARKDAS